MADSIKISLPSGYKKPTNDDIAKAKKWTLLRNENAARLSSLIEEKLKASAKQLTDIAYRYNCKPEDFQFSQDKDLREEVANVLNDLEDDIMELVEEYSLNETDDKKRRNNLLPWLMALHSKNTGNLGETLHERLRQFLFDTEAQIAAMKLANYNQTKAKNRILSTMHAVYASPEVQSAYKKKSAAMYIQSHGIHYGNVGLSSSGAVNVENFGKQTAIMTWMKSQLIEFEKNGAIGYYQLRGSSFPCSICDEEVGLHIGNIINDAYPHAHCVCYRVPISIDDDIVKSNNSEREKLYKELKESPYYYDVQFNSINSGLKATHIDHNFDKKGGEFEKEVQNAGYKSGNSVILEAEFGNIIGKRYTEGTWNGMSFEVAGCETATSNNILAGLSHCASKGNTKVAVLDFPNNNFNRDIFERTIGRYKGLKKLDNGQYLEFKKIICVQNGKIIVDIPFP